MNKRRPVTKGMVLAAGLGTRLLPITEKTPKPLVPVLNVPNVLFSLHLLKRAGILDVVLNTHHLPEPLERFLGDGSRWGMRLQFSRETLLLGTGGGLKKAQSFFGGEPLALVNCDFITDADLTPLLQRHVADGAMATMVLWENEKYQAFYSKVGIDDKDRLCSLPRCSTGAATRTGMFTGIHFLENEVFSYLKEVPSGINEVLYPTLMKEHPERARGSFMESTYWFDTGELKYLWSTSLELLRRLAEGDAMIADVMKTMGGYEEKLPGIWAPKDATIPEGVTLKAPVVFGSQCVWGQGSEIGPFAILGDGTHVETGAHASYFVALGRSRLPGLRASESALQFDELVLSMDRNAAF